MDQDAAEKMVATALALAMARDGSSGGMIRMVVCNKDGSTRKIIEGDKIALSWDERDTALLPHARTGMVVS